MNKVFLIGNLGTDAKTINNNDNSFTVLSLATNRKFKDKNNELQERTEWHSVLCFNKLGEITANLKKGTKIAIDGELRYKLKEMIDPKSNKQIKMKDFFIQAIKLEFLNQKFEDTESSTFDSLEKEYAEFSEKNN